MNPTVAAWYQGYVAYIQRIFTNPYYRDCAAQAWEDGFNQAMADWT